MQWRDLLEKRYSVRAYDRSVQVEPEKLERVLEAAVLAPTAANRQPFRVLVIPTEGREAELGTIYQRAWFTEAPYLLAVCALPDIAWVRKDGKNYSDVDAAIIMDHLVLAATAEGLGTCWVAAFDHEIARRVLSVEEKLEVIAFTPLGYAKAGATPPSRVRKEASDLIIYK
ncbi:nitroreductase family protein [Gorillibacterium massiliense]|uniref:nitroreductase family protein n=1 Tax=Gorillibacterium massiliense TaxID=1280390 RepID=UPI0004B132B2|nr:nitroreductase family protein [Gorillibacterium massiliense]